MFLLFLEKNLHQRSHHHLNHEVLEIRWNHRNRLRYFCFICKRNKINNCLIICFKSFIAQTNIARCCTTTKILFSQITTAFFFWREIIKVSLCTSHSTWTVLLKVEETYFCIIDDQIRQLLRIQGCSFYFHVSILVMYPIERWFYQNDLDTTTLNKFSHVE